jgi:signal transduction histidine kinase
MMINKDEKRLLLSIKIVPLVLFCIIAIIGMIIALYVNEVNFQNEIKKVRTVYLKYEKEIIKNEVIKIRNNIKNEKKLTEKKLKKSIKEQVYSAYAVIDNIYKQNQDKSKQEILKMVTDALREVRFNDSRGYFFMYKMDGKVLLLPPQKEFEGQNFINLKDAKGKNTIRDMRDLTLEHGESFYTWWWYKPNEKKFQSKKIGFAKYFKPLDCFIGTGEYVDEFEESIKKTMTERLSLYKYGKNASIFIFNKEGNTIAHNNQKLLGQKSFVYQNLQDKKFENVHESQDEGGGDFLKYSFKKQNEQKETTKISYILQYEEWGWTIGTGFYTDNLNRLVEKKKYELKKENEKSIQNIILICFVILIIVMILSILLSYAIENRFESYKNKVKLKDQLIFQQSKMAAMGEMIENIAHQWRQPLSVISTASSGLKVQQEYGLITKELLIKGLDGISESVEYLSETIDDFRDFYKDDKMKKTFNISSSIEKAVHLLHSKFRKGNIELHIKKSDVTFMGFENELVQVFMNILNNAREVLENMQRDRKLIFISVSQNEKNIQISLYDNGNGIDEKIISLLFDYKFTTKEKENGTGIGLYMSKLIIEKNGGTIIVQNKKFVYEGEEYHGAEFIITFKV